MKHSSPTPYQHPTPAGKGFAPSTPTHSPCPTKPWRNRALERSDIELPRHSPTPIPKKTTLSTIQLPKAPSSFNATAGIFFFEITKFYQWGTLKELMILEGEEGVGFSRGTLLPSLIIISGPPSPPYRSIHKPFTQGEKYNMGIQIKIYVYI